VVSDMPGTSGLIQARRCFNCNHLGPSFGLADGSFIASEL
jgi:hypothetical protein